MPLKALEAVSTSRNGVGAFILQCKRLDFHYCDWAGSSRGMNDFLRRTLPGLARQSPSVEVHVSPRPRHHPVIRAHYVGGASKAVCVRNLQPAQILAKARLLRDASGQKNRRLRAGRNVASANDGVRGVWSGLHGDFAQHQGFWGKSKDTKKA